MKNFIEYDFDIEQITISCYVAAGKGEPVHKNRSSHGIVFHTGGVRCYTFDNKSSITVGENDILYLPEGSNYTVETLEKGGCYAINFRLFRNISFAPFKFRAKKPSVFIDLFKNAEQVWSRKSSGYHMKCKSLLYNILFELRKEYEIGYAAKDTLLLIKPALDYIYKEYTGENIDIPYIAGLCNISEAYFRRLFLKKYGVSPVKFINNLKIDRAKELITSGIYSINEAAAASGFHDDSYFSRKFKEATGISPSEYKEKW